MRLLVSIIILLGVTGCCRTTPEISGWQETVQYRSTDVLYHFRLERAGQTKLAGILALKRQDNGMWGGLLDATGIPLVKLLVTPEGDYETAYCAAAVCDTRLPEVLGKLIHSIYFTPAREDCPWYTVSCICEKSGNDKTFKWKKIGPFRSWQLTLENPGSSDETISMKMYFSSVEIQLRRSAATLRK